MAIGYFLLVGDKTTCGGQIITGDHTMTFNGRATAREGDKVTCGKHPGTYVIVGGVSDVFDMGRKLAGTLDSVSTCPCRARFINSEMDSYEMQDKTADRVVAPTNMAQQHFSSPVKDVGSPPATQVPPPPIPVFTKSCQRGKGCTDAGTEPESANNFGRMAIYQVPSSPAPVTAQKPEPPPQDKKHPPEPDKPRDKKLPWYKRWFRSGKDNAEAAATAVAATTRSAVAEGETLVMRYIGGGAISAGRWLAAPNPVTVGLMGLFYSPSLNQGEEDYLDPYRLRQIAEQYGKAPTRVRFRWIRDEKSGRMTVQGYHVSPEGGLDKVPVRMMTLNRTTGNYEFWEPGETRPTILWTPNEQEFKAPAHTGNEEQPFIPSQITVLPIPDKVGSDIESLPMPEEKDFRDYILVFPIPNMPPVYVYLSKPPVKLFEVDLYRNFAGRLRNGTHADHMPSAAAIRANLMKLYPNASPTKLNEANKDAAAIIIPAEVHQKISATYGGRNTPYQIEQDSRDLRAAVDRDFDTITPALKDYGATEMQLKDARAKIHKLNEEQGVYK
ncbi:MULTISPECIES: S-type pyocin domain-containing protein [Photorhabdus]|uniref:Killer protein of pyocin s3 n=1 Tax=Photorhabdus kayaii TaxID=230088 RepID=A0ABX0B0Q7_9GAMM|nr:MULTISPECIES: S-type pyocin domain-containing protein [Photorhabdus]MCC8373734.1 S-type pyocin domain-containing protein [Photorhabdus bodei]MCT8353386.1 S-type pyocin domain-containing protein [Photorhabdus kayaii]MDB6369548.1 S-type pyocin domain-containing protein [Photorhabdus bodei]NDL13325.1 killer protein of pyocin s3 [Photorhabdus kayaii]NDL26687.1 killer protein of pyocin s3 [Photorhabdus kayaii]